jgi:hypothetical protein
LRWISRARRLITGSGDDARLNRPSHVRFSCGHRELLMTDRPGTTP